MNEVRISRRTITIILMIVFMTAVDVILGYVMMHKTGEAMMSMLDSRMLDIVTTAADMTDGDALAKVTEKDRGTEKYDDIYDTLSYFQYNTGLEAIFAVRKVGEQHLMLVADASDGGVGEFGDEVEDNEAIRIAFSGTTSIDREPYRDGMKRYYSAYCPVWDSSGNIAGVIAADFSSEWYVEQLRAEARMIRIICVLFLLTGLAVIFVMSQLGGHEKNGE